MEADIITSREMRTLEENAEYYGISRLQLMENAGHNIACEIKTRFQSKKTQVTILCGLGGNGGDGFVAARHLLSLGYTVEVMVAGQTIDIKHEAAKKNWLSLQPLHDSLKICEVGDSSQIPHIKAEVIVDALLGTGLKGSPRPPIPQLIEKINKTQAFRIAVDVPTGLNSDTGETLGETVKANLTITLHKAKPGLLKATGYVGELLVKDIGLPEPLERFAGPGDVALVVRPRPRVSHKGDFGRLLIVGGSEIYSGAPLLAALAALRTGTDLAYVAAPEKTAYAISSKTPNLITVKLKGKHLNLQNLTQIAEFIEKATCIIIGPGLGLHEETKETTKELVRMAEKTRTPVLLDADGLKAFSDFKQSIELPLVMTPHAGEFAILTGKKLPSSLEEKKEKVRRAAARLGGVILLKGHTDIISDGKKVKLNFTGNPGMTVGGTGDILSGIVGAFLGQHVDPFEAAVAGAFVNGAAGDFVKHEKGYHMLPTDLINWIPTVLDDPMSHLKVRGSEHKAS